jgi:membrane glycosyltransferase
MNPAPQGGRFDPARLRPEEAGRRRHAVVTLVLLLTGPAVLTMADLHWRTGFDGWKVLHLLVFTLLFFLVALGSAQALVGYRLRRDGGDPWRIGDSLDPADEGFPLTVRTAVVMPICNEEVGRVIEGLRSIYQSVERTGRMEECHFFLLSDSTDPNCWVAEEAAWLALTRELGAQGRIFYRKRKVGINKKAGNLADFCRRWGKLYRYMVVLDADSIMTGDAIVRLVRLMERNRRVGIIQGVPLLANGETILARLQQFASRLYGPISAAGLNYWQLSEANYWGHNAIIRLAPFIRHCSLPDLPGAGAFGGRILSHDYVEAALMRRAGWEVWLVTETAGNYEECPATVIDLAQRDRRWLQGNLQHARLIVAKGFHPVNRVHFILGILAYLASPLWLAFLVLSTVIAARATDPETLLRPGAGFAAYVHWSYAGEAVSLFAYTILLLFLPKALALLDLRSRPEEVARFGGWGKLLEGVSLETLIFTLLAPVLMLFHSWFIAITVLGSKVTWGTQRRGAGEGSPWLESIAAHGVQTILGVLATLLVFRIDPRLGWWMSPILAGLVLSIPLSYLTGSPSLGTALRQRGIFQTPEESQPVPELEQIATAMALRRDGKPASPSLRAHYGLLQAVLDPYVNAVHVSLLREKDDPPVATEERFAGLRARLLRDGPKALSPRDRMALLMNAESMRVLHDQVWGTPAARLADWWKLALQHYALVGPAPQTAFSR